MNVYDPRLYQALAIRKGLELYAKNKIQLNRAWTPKAMLRTASAITGERYTRGQYAQAIEGLSNWIKNHANV